MSDARAGLQRTEEIDGMIGRIAEEQRDGRPLADAGAQISGGRDVGHCLQFGEADPAIAELDRRSGAKIARRLRQEIRQRSAFDRVVPADALRIKLFAGMGHGLYASNTLSFRSTRSVNPEFRDSGSGADAPAGNDVSLQ